MFDRSTENQIIAVVIIGGLIVIFGGHYLRTLADGEDTTAMRPDALVQSINAHNAKEEGANGGGLLGAGTGVVSGLLGGGGSSQGEDGGANVPEDAFAIPADGQSGTSPKRDNSSLLRKLGARPDDSPMTFEETAEPEITPEPASRLSNIKDRAPVQNSFYPPSPAQQATPANHNSTVAPESYYPPSATE